MRYQNNYIRFFACVSVLYSFGGCSGEERVSEMVTDRHVTSLVNKITNAKYVKDIFHADTLRITIPSEFALGAIRYIHVSEEGDLFLVDPKFSGSVLRFNKHGQFRGQLGQQGKGPGEYQIPWHVITMNEKIFVSDVGVGRISVFDTSGAFLHSFQGQAILDGLYAGDNTLITHQLRVPANSPTIHVYSEKGKLLARFGETSEFYRKFQPLAYTPSGPFLAYQNGFFFQTEYTDYRVTAYTNKGTFIKVFGVKPEQYRSPETTPVELIPRAKYATPDYINKIKDYYDNYLSKCSELGGILAIGDGVILTYILNRSKKTGFENRYYLNFYTASGELIKNDVPFKGKARRILLSPPDKIIIYEYESDFDYSDQIIRLIILSSIKMAQTVNEIPTDS